MSPLKVDFIHTEQRSAADARFRVCVCVCAVHVCAVRVATML